MKRKYTSWEEAMNLREVKISSNIHTAALVVVNTFCKLSSMYVPGYRKRKNVVIRTEHSQSELSMVPEPCFV